MGAQTFANIHEAINNCIEQGINECGAVLFDEFNGAHLRREKFLVGESNPASLMGSWIRTKNSEADCSKMKYYP